MIMIMTKEYFLGPREHFLGARECFLGASDYLLFARDNTQYLVSLREVLSCPQLFLGARELGYARYCSALNFWEFFAIISN